MKTDAVVFYRDGLVSRNSHRKPSRNTCQIRQKRQQMLLQGKLTFNPWLGRQGTPQVSADLLLQDFQFVGGGKDDENEAEEADEHSNQTEISDDVQEISDQTQSY